MYNNQTIMAIIPARAGSKGIKDKNIIDFCGHPLIAHSIMQAKNSKYIDEVYVSTDGEKISDISKNYGASVPFLRPDELATDTSPTHEALIDMIEKLERIYKKYDHILLLQPTSPLRTTSDIDNAIEKYFQTNSTSLVSVKELQDSLELIYKDENNRLKKYLPNDTSTRRQDFKTYYVLNGAIYIISTAIYKEQKTFITDDTGYYLMNAKSSVDIDEPLDLEIARVLYDKI